MARHRRWLFDALALLLGGLAALAIAEVVIRAAGLDADELQITFDPGTAVWGRFEPAKGWMNLEGRQQNNRQGFRFPRNYTRESEVGRRIVLLGDSQVWGTGVEADEHMGVMLDSQLAQAEVYPFGVPGYGPVQELLLLREVLRDYEVDEVFAVAFVYNDLVDESVSLAYGGLQKPYLEETPEGWVLRNVPVPRPILASGEGAKLPFFGRAAEMDFLVPNERLAELSALYRLIAQRSSYHPRLARVLARLGFAEIVTATATVSEHYSIRRIDGRDVPCWHLEACPEEHWLDGLPAVTAAYVEMDRLCGQHAIEFAVVLTPSYMEMENGRFDVIDALARSLFENGIRVIDLRQAFRSEADWRNVMGSDRHWTALGHRIVTDALVRATGKAGR